MTPATPASAATAPTPSLVEKVWDHYRNYLESSQQGNEDGQDNEGDIDELTALLSLVEEHDNKSLLLSSSSLSTKKNEWTESLERMVPLVCSMAHYHLADIAITNTIDQNSGSGSGNGNDEDLPDADVDNCGVVFTKSDVLKHLQASLECFPLNAATWSVGSNYARMTRQATPRRITEWYHHAAKCASLVRTTALERLENEETPDQMKEWLELLVLDGITGTDYCLDEASEENGADGDDDDDDAEGSQDKNGDGNGEDEDEEEDDDDDGYFGPSSVEAVSRFMSAMLLSTMGDHDTAKSELERFGLTHRLHPNVWRGQLSKKRSRTEASIPCVFRDGVLPAELYRRMCEVFAPDAVYWKESSYARRGYISYFMDVPASPSTHQPMNLLEHVILHHLLPLAQKRTDETIVGAEWWAHTRPIQANLGHNLHFDTDEGGLADRKLVSHPIVSSVLYLTSGKQDNGSNGTSSTAGATIVLDQTPDAKTVADSCWICTPKDNSFMLFPGNLLHGVLPCPGTAELRLQDQTDTPQADGLVFEFNAKPSEDASGTSSANSGSNNRLTFMIGFWTRNVPAGMTNRELYGPCGPLPPDTEQWVKEISKGYPTGGTTNDLVDPNERVEPVPLPTISPAWEELETTEQTQEGEGEGSTDEPLLQIPHAIDHRFFVSGAPECFRESLFEAD